MFWGDFMLNVMNIIILYGQYQCVFDIFKAFNLNYVLTFNCGLNISNYLGHGNDSVKKSLVKYV